MAYEVVGGVTASEIHALSIIAGKLEKLSREVAVFSPHEAMDLSDLADKCREIIGKVDMSQTVTVRRSSYYELKRDFPRAVGIQRDGRMWKGVVFGGRADAS